MPGVAGNNTTTPAAAANQIVGDIDIRWFGAMNDWTPAFVTCLASRWRGGGASQSYYFRLDTNGLSFFTTADGATVRTANVVAAIPFLDGVAGWLRVTRAAATGNVNFYTSTDGTVWTQLGVQQATPVEGIFAGVEALSIGNLTLNFDIAIGKCFRVLLLNTIGSAVNTGPVASGPGLAQDYNPQNWPETATNGATAVSSTTGETWTLNNTGNLLAQIVGSPQVLANGTGHFMQMATPLVQPTTLYSYVKPITWTGNDRIHEGFTLNAGVLYQLGVTPNLQSFSGANIGPVSPVLNTYGTIREIINGAASGIGLDGGALVAGNTGAANMAGLTLFADAGGTNNGNAQAKEVIGRRGADSAALQAQIITLLNIING